MAPGVNDGPRNTGTLPKSNRRNNRNREIPSVNQQTASRSVYHGRAQHPNNLLDWQPVNDRETVRSTKNSNARSTASAQSISYPDFADIVSYGGGRQYNYTTDECSHWQEMAQPADSRTQSPPQLQRTKPTNVDKMPDRRQVESRLYQIRDYIGVTSTMIESLSQSSDPRARTQHEKLSRMVEDLYDSETKLAKLLEDYNVRGIADESGDHQPLRSDQMKRFVEILDVLGSQERFLVTNSNRRNSESGKEDGEENGNETLEAQLRRKMEASQRKLAELQEHQANLAGMQLQVRERLNAARQAQQALLQQENQAQAAIAPVTPSPAWETPSRGSQPPQGEPDEIDAETAMLRSKLAHLQSKKKHMDQLMVELQAVELSDRASVSSESSRNAERDKSAELEVLKAQLAHLKSLMEEATRVREVTSSTVEPEHESNANNAIISENPEVVEDDTGAAASYNSFDRHSEIDELSAGKSRNSKERPSVEEIQAATRELKEQSTLLQAARAELRRLKQASGLTCVNNAAANSIALPSPTPPPSISSCPVAEKKQSNSNNNNNNNSANNHHANGDVQQAQTKKRQMEELVRKEQSNSSSVNRDVTAPDWGSRRGSNSQLSHTSTPANVWPHPNAAGGSNEPSVDGVSSSENLLDIGPQITAVENGFGTSWWNEPAPMVNAPQNGPAGTAEYYRQLLMGSQAQQLQMMGTTMQQCCQLLWAQQRELQSMRSAITQLQQQFRQTQSRNNEIPENREDYSNLGRSAHHLGSTLDASLPPSSSLPNLVSLPNSASAPSQNPAVASAGTSQQQQQQPQQQQQQQQQQQPAQQQQQQQQNHHQQLNNQVPPGNRANNYWDNFRSYSRQNLLSGNTKTVLDSIPGPSGNSVTSTNTAGGSVNSAHVRDKRNREHGADNLPLQSISSAEAQYSLNLQLQSNLQSQERETPVARSNILSNETSSQQQVDNFWEESHASFHQVTENNDDVYSLRHMSGEMRDILGSLVAANRRRPDYLVIILREIKAISNDHRLRPRLLRSLRALQDTQSLSNPLNEVTDQTASESCQSSDEDSDFGAQARALTPSNASNRMLLSEIYVPLHSSGQAQQMEHPQLVDHFEFEAAMPLESINAVPTSSSLTPGYNEDLAEADQSRPEASSSQQGSPEDDNNDGDENEESQGAVALEISRDITDAIYPEEDVAIMESSILDRIPTRLFHH